jgi:hypothetical protein
MLLEMELRQRHDKKVASAGHCNISESAVFRVVTWPLSLSQPNWRRSTRPIGPIRPTSHIRPCSIRTPRFGYRCPLRTSSSLPTFKMAEPPVGSLTVWQYENPTPNPRRNLRKRAIVLIEASYRQRNACAVQPNTLVISERDGGPADRACCRKPCRLPRCQHPGVPDLVVGNGLSPQIRRQAKRPGGRVEVLCRRPV